MKLLRMFLLFVVSGVSFLNAWPNKVLVKNETKEMQMISGEVVHVATKFATGESSIKFSIGVDTGKEVELKAFYPSEIGTISNATITFAGKPVDLGSYSAIRIVIFQKDGVVSARTEPLSRYIAARMAMANWWSRTQSSWSSFWSKVFSRK